jgi:hypothetical protein
MTAIQSSVDEFLSTVKEKLPDAEAGLAKLFTEPALSGLFHAGDAGDTIGKKESSMPDDPKKVADLEKAVADLTKRAETAEAIAKLSGVEKAHYDKLGDADKPGFLAKSADDRKAEIAKAGDADPVVYKSADGVEFRKSDDPRLVAMAKRADEADRIAKAERETRETAEFTKRAETEIGHLPGDAALKGKVLKHLASAPEDVAKAADTMLKAGDSAIAKSFTKFGVAGGDPTGDNPEAKLNSLAKAHAEKNNVSFAKAYSAVLDTEEGKRLYAETRQAA